MKTSSSEINHLDVVAIGELLIDFAPYGVNDVNYPILSALPGGAPANFLAACSARGLKAGFIGGIGDDYFGQRLSGTLQDLDIDVSAVQVYPEAFTTLAFVTLDETGDRSFSFARKPGADQFFKMDDKTAAVVKNARCLHFGTFIMSNEATAAEMIYAVEYARQNGVWISFDPNYRSFIWRDENKAREAILWGLTHTDSTKIGLDELVFAYPELSDVLATGDSTQREYVHREAVRRLFSNDGIKIAFITMGVDGSIVARRTSDQRVEWVFVDGFTQATTVDTTGAGDIFGGTAWSLFYRLCQRKSSNKKESGGFTLDPHLLSKRDLLDIGVIASATASLSTTRFGGISSVPQVAEVADFLQNKFDHTKIEIEQLIQTIRL
ncbi:MAG: carbohydrate kinase family protein [Fastidiosipilaceae bacterium]|nr:carbohydrate kinase [Clostridiaceae bacterium]